MSRPRVRRAFATVLLLALAAPVGAQSFAWWKDEGFQKEVGLTPDQCTRIDNIFQTTLPKLKQGKAELDRLEAELSQMIETNADEALVVKQIDRIESVRATLNKTRTLMLLHEHQVITPGQLVKFKAAYAKWTQDHRNRGRTQ
jgi:Spy/CpxP family protein refolding chaperone